MDFTLPAKAFLKQHFDLKSLSGHEKFLAVGANLSHGSCDTVIDTAQVKKGWSKTSLKIAYHGSYYVRAQTEGWVHAVGKGKFVISDKGFSYLAGIGTEGSADLPPGQNLRLFTMGQTHSFDKFLRTALTEAIKHVRIADSYVDGTIFDNLLDQIPEQVPIHLMYGEIQGDFKIHAKRFGIQYSGFAAKHSSTLHDRFLLIDDTGYIIGPSLKDAARKSPALVVELGGADSKKLMKFFDGMWGQAKPF